MKKLLGLLLTLLISSPALGVDINGQLKKAQLEQQSSDPTAATARVYFNTLTNTAKIYNGTAWTSLGSGAGSGEKNYVSNGSSSAVGWTASSGNITCATTTSSMPDPSLGTALAITGVSGSTDFCYTNFTLDDADFAKKLKLAWDQYAVSNTSADFRVDVCACAVAWSGGACSAGTVAQGCGTNSTRLPLSTDASSASLLPALTGSYRTTYDAIGASKKYMQVQVGLAQTNTHQVNLANIVAGPGVVTQGAALSDWQSYTPTFSAGLGTVTNIAAYYRRVGSSVHVYMNFLAGTVAASAANVSLPSGLTMNTGLTTTQSPVGRWDRGNATASTRKTGVLVTSSANGTTVSFASDDYTAAASPYTIQQGSTLFATGDAIQLEFSVPVNEWAGSGTVNISGGDGGEFVSNSDSSSTASNSLSFIYGSSGGSIPNGGTGTTYIRRVRFNAPVSTTDQVLVEIDQGSSGASWFSAAQWFPRYYQQSQAFGIEIDRVSATDFDVYFGSGGYTATSTYNAAGAAWSTVTNWKWRVRRLSSQQAVGMANASATANGLVSYENGITYQNGTSNTLTWSTTPATYTVRFYRTGKNVTVDLTFPSVVPTNATLLSVTLPADFKPSPASKYGLLTCSGTGCPNGFTMIDADADGHIYLGNSAASLGLNTFDGVKAINSGSVAMSFSYSLQ